MDKLKVVLNTGLSGTDGSFGAGEEVDLPLEEALLRIERGEAEPKVKKHYEAALEKREKLAQEAAEKQAAIDAVAKKDELTERLRGIYREEAEVSAALAGVILSDEEIEDFVKTRMEGEPPFRPEEGGNGK
ncbi:hypothetical protein WCX72_09945 [Sulfurimonas sp. HSL1-6]|uniref:hypothetical protein n=1 Tax=Thiomicrolovo immobilis TaxID=3131935 RepID=UPI0031F9FB00